MRALMFVPLFLLTLGCFMTSVHADTRFDRKAATANETAVRQVYERWAKAFTDHDLDKILSFRRRT